MKRDSSTLRMVSGELGTNGHSTKEHDSAVAGILAVARRELLALATALQSNRDDAALLAATRLRWAIASAHAFAGRTPTELLHARPALAVVFDAAQRWLPTDDRLALTPDHVQQLLGEFRAPTARPERLAADNTLLIGFDLDDLPLAQLGLRGATVAHVTARRAQLDAADATGAKVVDATFRAATMCAAIFDSAVVEDCDLSCANLERSSWNEARVARCSLEGAVLLDARLGMATFLGCDFRDAELQAMQPLEAKGAVFLGCDLRNSQWHGRTLRGADFLDCKLYGVRGAPDLDGATIERPDLSPAGDGSQIGTEAEAIALWRGVAKATWS